MKNKSAAVVLYVRALRSQHQLGCSLKPNLGRIILHIFFSCLSISAIFAQPVITSFSPLSGFSGSTVTIYGKGFSAVAERNIVYVNGLSAIVLTAASTKLTVRVPKGGSASRISVTTDYHTGFSAVPFIVTNKAGGDINAGTFTIPVNLPSKYKASLWGNWFVEDLDGDGKTDILTSGTYNDSESFFAIFRNTSTPGNISFAPALFFDIPRKSSFGITDIGDIDGDGKKDLLCTNFVNIKIYKNTSTPGRIWFDTIELTSANRNVSVKLQDIDADGKLDMVIHDPSYELPTYMKNTSKGTSISFTEGTLLPAYARSFNDFNGDGKIDILSFPRPTSNGYYSFGYKNTGANGKASFADPVILFPGEFSAFRVVGDVNKDGKPDVMASTYTNGTGFDTMRYFINTSTRSNISFKTVSLPQGLVGNTSNVADIDGDGRADITGYNLTSNLLVLRNTTVNNQLAFDTLLSIPEIKGTLPGFCDFDGDGKLDLATLVDDLTSYVSIYRNQTDASPAAPTITTFSPRKALMGDTLFIKGTNFKGASNVTLGGVPVKLFSVVSDSLIKAIVNNGNTGYVTVTTKKGVVNKSLFTYNRDTVVKITSDAPSSFCWGTQITLRADVINAKKAITYTWFRNGIPVIAKGNIYFSNSFKKGDSVWCEIVFPSNTQDPKRWKSNVLTFAVNSTDRPKMYISSDKGNKICKGTLVTFNAVVTNGDFQPVFQWQKNDVMVGNSSNTYTDSTLQNGDSIRCTIIKAQECTLLPATASIKIAVAEKKPDVPVAIMGPDEVTALQIDVVFRVDPPMGAESYKWLLPGGAFLISGERTNSIVVNWTYQTAKISVAAFNICGYSAFVTKVVRVDETNQRIAIQKLQEEKAGGNMSFQVYPNPASNKASVFVKDDGNSYNIIELRDATGKLLLHKKVQAQKGVIRTEINTTAFAPGVYYVVLTDQNNKPISKRLMISK